VVIHLLFDFVFQGKFVAAHKKPFNAYTISHGLSMGFVCGFVFWTKYLTLLSFFGSFFVIATTHILVDSLKVLYASRFKNPSALLGFDQLSHVTVLYLLFSTFSA
jgi:hypothetical protein